jgi:uncharacterized protein YndB with AHSA1/START domain
MNDDVAFVYETTIRTSPERLWEALTSGELTRTYWFDRRVESSWTPGAPVTFFVGDTDEVADSGEVIEADPPRRLAYMFAPVGYELTRVTFDLEPVADGVRLRLVQDRLADPSHVEQWRDGWTPILTNLQNYLEGNAVETTADRDARSSSR